LYTSRILNKSGKNTRQLHGQEGFILIMALLFIVVLSLMAITSVRLTTVEFKIAGNERVAKVNFFNSEAASLEGVQRNLNLRTATELNPNSEFFDATKNPSLVNAVDDKDDMANLDKDGDGTPLEDADLVAISFASDGIVQGRLDQLVVLNNFTAGESLSQTNDSQVYTFTSYGYSKTENGSSLVKVGFKKEVFKYSDE